MSAIHHRPNGTGKIKPRGPGRFQAVAPGRQGKCLGTFGSYREAEEALQAHLDGAPQQPEPLVRPLWQIALDSRRIEQEKTMSLRDKLDGRGLLKMAERIAEAHGVSVEDMFSAVRGFSAVPRARQAMWAELYATGNWSYPRIGQLFGRDHTTIMAGVRKAMVRQMRDGAGKEVA